ncbi:MAG: leucine-rich repeat domain-containing protein [Treponema sp.]|jgi:hypothetical protein|nr:leucine-rich repeat domain-containing protein [Treponema sp.]
MKKLLFILIPVLLFASCIDTLSPPGNEPDEEFPDIPESIPDNDSDEDQEPQTKGKAIIELVTDKAGENLLPREWKVVRYSLNFINEAGESAPAVDLEGETFEYAAELEGGLWTVSALGFIAAEGGGEPIPAAEGSAEIDVTEGETVLARIPLAWMSRGGGDTTGTFSFAVEFPNNRIKTAMLTLSRAGDEEQYGYMETIDLKKIHQSNKSEGVLNLPSGTYRMELFMSGLFYYLACTKDLYIYPDMESDDLGYHFDDNDFPEPVELSGAAALRTYLDSLPENSENDPYLIRLSGIDLSSPDTSGDTLRTLYDSLTRFAALDLSDCTGTELPSITVTAAPNKKHLAALILPESVAALSRNCFVGCTNLVTAEFPGVAFIGRGAFADCATLERIFLPRLETLEDGTSSAQGVFCRNTALTQVWLPEARNIGAYAFNGCSALAGLSLPAAETLGAYALKGCLALVSVNIPRVHTTGSQAFHGCDSLVSLTLPSLRTMGNQGFYSCDSLSGLSLPSVTSIGKQSFYGCPVLKSITLGENPPVFDGGAIFSKGKPSEAINVPAAALDAYMTTGLEEWTDLLKEKLKPLITL